MEQYVSARFKEALKNINTELEKQREIQTVFTTYSNEYQESLMSEIALLEQKSKLLEKEEEKLQKLI